MNEGTGSRQLLLNCPQRQCEREEGNWVGGAMRRGADVITQKVGTGMCRTWGAETHFQEGPEHQPSEGS